MFIFSVTHQNALCVSFKSGKLIQMYFLRHTCMCILMHKANKTETQSYRIVQQQYINVKYMIHYNSLV